MRAPVAAVLVKARGHLGNAQARLGGVDDEFGRKLHACGAYVHTRKRRAAKGTHATMEITHRGMVYGTRDP